MRAAIGSPREARDGYHAGKAPDLVLYGADSLEEIDAVLKPTMVMKAGEIVAGQAL